MENQYSVLLYTDGMEKISSEVKVAVGSKNEAKNKAVATAFLKAYAEIDIRGFDVDSGISDQPTTDEESIEGAINRAQGALTHYPEARYGVGLEGNTVTISGRMFLHGWVAIIEKGNETPGIGHSSGIELPEHLKQAIEEGKELGPLLQSMLDDKENLIRHTQGTNGILSAGLYTREQEFIDATTVALARFISSDMYKSTIK